MTATLQAPLRCGVLGKTAIARTFGDRIQLTPQLQLVADSSARDTECDWLFIGSDFTDRAESIRQALLAGRHVIAPAPIAVSPHETRQLFELAQAQTRRLELWLPQRGDAEFHLIQQLTHSGEIGDIRRLRYELRQLSPWMLPVTDDDSLPTKQRAGDEQRHGVLNTFGWAALDQLLELANAPVQRVFARMTSHALQFGDQPGNAFPANVESGVIAVIEFANGCEAQLDIDLATTSTSGPSWWVQGGRGGYERGRLSQTMSDGELFDVPMSRAAVDPMQCFIELLMQSDEQTIAARYEHWISVTKVASAIRESSATGRVVTFGEESNDQPRK